MMKPLASRIETVLAHACALLLLLAGTARAELPGAAPFELHTYGSLGLARSTSEQPGYRTNSNYQFELGEHWSGQQDNRLGVQLSARITPQLAVITQGMVRRNGDDEVKPNLTWAYLRWQPDNQWEVRLGRVRHPLFMITEEMDVGYAHPWVRPPVEVYGLGGESSFNDGLQLRYRQPLGDYTLGVEGYVGRYTLRRSAYTNRIKFNRGLAVALTDSRLTLRATLSSSDIHLTAPKLDPVAAMISAQDAAVGREYALGSMSGFGYLNLGLRYEANDWLVMAEYVQTDSPRRLLPDQQAGYVTLGHGFGDWLPYVSLARLRTLSGLHERRLSGMAAVVANAILAGHDRDQSTLSLGLRWDVQPNLAIKAQLDRVRPDNAAYGMQRTPLPAGRSALNVGSLVMDWVY